MTGEDRDLFGNPIPPKRRRGRPRGQITPSADGQPGAQKPVLTAPTPPGLGDLVTRLKPLHRRIESDLAATLAGDAALQAAVAGRCQTLSQDLGVVVGARQYLHTAATVIILKALFLRVAEDYGLFPGPARKVALRGDLFSALRDLAPRLTWADYLEYAIRDLAYIPVAYDLFKETGYELVAPSGELTRTLLDAVGDLPDLRPMDTRALGDLYQYLMDPEERKRLAYYPTPDFIIDFLLDRTLEPAIREFGVYDLRYLDICSGTGHFGVRTYRRLDRHLAATDPSLTPLERFERIVENNLFAIDVSEFATRITLFRLFLEGVRLALREGRDPAAWGADLTFNVYTANSLIKLPRQEAMPLFADSRPPNRELDPVAPWYRRELTHLRVDLHDALAKGFHVINANPPYVRIQRQGAQVVAPVNGSWQVVDFVEYLRHNYKTASGSFDLSVPFAERGLELLVPGGYLGYITSSKFSKQAYGTKIATALTGDHCRLLFFGDLADARVFEAGTYPALIVLQRPSDDVPVPPDAPVEVLATYQPAAAGGESDWAALRSLLAGTGDIFEPFAGHYTERQGHFRSHPWTLRRGKGNLLARICAASDKALSDYVASIGFDVITAANPVFCDFVTASFIRRNRLEDVACIPCPRGENIRNWTVTWHGNRKLEQTYAVSLHKPDGGRLPDEGQSCPNAFRFLLKYRARLQQRRIHSSNIQDLGIHWYEFAQSTFSLGTPKIVFPTVSMFGHFYLDAEGRFLQRHPAQVMHFHPETDVDGRAALCVLLNSHLTNYVIKASAGKLSGRTEDKARFEWPERVLASLPIPSSSFGEATAELSTLYRRVREVAIRLEENSPYELVRHLSYSKTNEHPARIANARSTYMVCWQTLQTLQDDADRLVEAIYGLCPDDALELWQPAFKKPWEQPAWDAELAFEVRDFLCDLVEDLFAAQRSPQERPLGPAQIANALAQNAKLEALRAIYYGGRPISAEQFVHECLDWDCRPIPFDPEAVLVGRKPKRVDILHERFFRFDGVDRNLYGWTGWSAEAQANVFLTLAERAQDRLPFYRWVSRLIHLPEESPDIADPSLRAGLKALIGDEEPYPYVVMEKE